jgi:hypothetical protein
MKESIAYLNDLADQIVAFSDKVKPGGYLRGAILSHLRVSFNLNTDEAEKVLDYWINEYKP